jgi:hypothetical protein
MVGWLPTRFRRGPSRWGRRKADGVGGAPSQARRARPVGRRRYSSNSTRSSGWSTSHHAATQAGERKMSAPDCTASVFQSHQPSRSFGESSATVVRPVRRHRIGMLCSHRCSARRRSANGSAKADRSTRRATCGHLLSPDALRPLHPLSGGDRGRFVGSIGRPVRYVVRRLVRRLAVWLPHRSTSVAGVARRGMPRAKSSPSGVVGGARRRSSRPDS